eukprot:SAG11_NODE_218_length_12212_cov_7.026005_6_plen_86_part_00
MLGRIGRMTDIYEWHHKKARTHRNNEAAAAPFHSITHGKLTVSAAGEVRSFGEDSCNPVADEVLNSLAQLEHNGCRVGVGSVLCA